MGLCLSIASLSRLSTADTASEASSVSEMSLPKGSNLEFIKPPNTTKKPQDSGDSPTKKLPKSPRKPRNSSKRTKTNKKAGKSKKKSMLQNDDNKWAEHELSEQASRSERKVRKKKYYQNEYDLEELRRGAIVWEKRQGMQWHELEGKITYFNHSTFITKHVTFLDFEDALENDVKKNRRARRNRKIEESFKWSLH